MVTARIIVHGIDYALAFSDNRPLVAPFDTLAQAAVRCKELGVELRHEVPANHGSLKGSFLCLGNWYNLFHPESRAKLEAMVKRQSGLDLKTAKNEIARAKLDAEKWRRLPFMDFLYDYANAIGEWEVRF